MNLPNEQRRRIGNDPRGYRRPETEIGDEIKNLSSLTVERYYVRVGLNI